MAKNIEREPQFKEGDFVKAKNGLNKNILTVISAHPAHIFSNGQYILNTYYYVCQWKRGNIIYVGKRPFKEESLVLA